MSKQRKPLYEFGPFRLDSDRTRLTLNDELISLSPKAMEILLVLVESGGALVEKEELMRQVWPDSFVEEGNLSVHIFALRKALAQSRTGENYIETIPRQGFRFRASVRSIESNGETLTLERHRQSQITIKETESVAVAEATQQPTQLVTSPTWASLQTRRWAIALVILVVGISGVLVFFRFRGIEKKASLLQIRTIAVLPLKSLSGDSDDEFLRVGMADALITKLGSLRQVVVRPTSAILRYNNSKEEPQSIGRALGVEAVLEGHLQRDGDRIRVTLQLVSAGDGSQIWSNRFDDVFTNIFSVQDSISNQVVRSLSITLSSDDQTKLAKRYTQNTDAYHSYLIGQHYLNKRTDESLKKAIDYFKQAIDKDPVYALAYAGLAESYTLSSYYSAAPPRETFPKAKAAAQRALEIDESLGEAQTTLAYVEFIYDWNFQAAEKDFLKAFDLNPNHAVARFWYGECLMYLGRFVEGIAQIRRAHELDPLSPVYNANIGWAYHIARQDDLAIKQLQQVIQSDSNYHMAYFYLGMAYESKGMFDDAISAYQKAAELSGGYPGRSGLAHAYAISGKREEALKILAQMDDEARHQKPVRATAYALIFAGLNDLDKAFEWLEKGYEERYEGVIFLKVQPYYDNLRSDPRYSDLLYRIGLPN